MNGDHRVIPPTVQRIYHVSVRPYVWNCALDFEHFTKRIARSLKYFLRFMLVLIFLTCTIYFVTCICITVGFFYSYWKPIIKPER